MGLGGREYLPDERFDGLAQQRDAPIGSLFPRTGSFARRGASQAATRGPAGPQALAALRASAFDGAILDINLGGLSGLDILKSMRSLRPEMPVLIVSMYPEGQFAGLAFERGADAYLSKDVTPDVLVGAIRRLGCAPKQRRNVPTSAVPGPSGDPATQPPHYRLSPRELRILTLIVEGHSLTEIGKRLLLSVKTISTYRARILEKLEVGSNAEPIRYAVHHGIGAM